MTKRNKLLNLYMLQKDKSVEGEPPLTFQTKGHDLKNYRIYGNTVNGESVGNDRNLFKENWLTSNNWYFENHVLKAVNKTSDSRSWGYAEAQFRFSLAAGTYTMQIIPIQGATALSSGWGLYTSAGVTIDSKNREFYDTEPVSFTFTLQSSTQLGFMMKVYNGEYKYRLVEGSAISDLQFVVPVTVNSGSDTRRINIDIPAPIRKIGDETEYIDYKEQKQYRVRKNLLHNTEATQTINGVTFTVKKDGSVTCDGTSTSAYYSLFQIPIDLDAGDYILSGCPSGGADKTYRADFRENRTMIDGSADTGNGSLITVDHPGTYHYAIRIQKQYTVENKTFYPMIRKVSIQDNTYEQYIEDIEPDVVLPAIPTFRGENTLSFGTVVQPSNVYIKT